MSLFDTLPTPEQINTLLTDITGNAAAGTGLAGARQLLQNINLGDQVTGLQGKLNGNLAANLTIDPEVIGNALAQFTQATQALPADPSTLLRPVTDQFALINDLALNAIPAKLTAGVAGLQAIETVTPPDLAALLPEALTAIDNVRAELLTGALSELRQWSAGLTTLQTELAPLLTGDPGTVADQLIAYLAARIADLVRDLLPEPGGLAQALSVQLDNALAPERLATFAQLKATLIEQMNAIKAQFDGGDFTDLGPLTAALTTFTGLTTHLTTIDVDLRTALRTEWANASGLTLALQRELDSFAEVEVVQLGNVKQRFVQAFAKVESVIRQLNLAALRSKVEAIFAKIQGIIEQASLAQLLPDLTTLVQPLQAAADLLNAGVFELIAAVRSAFQQMAQTLSQVTSALGAVDENGHVTFHIQQQVAAFLNGIKDNLQTTIQPLLDGLNGGITTALQQVTTILTAVQAQIESVKTALGNALQGVADQLTALDVPGKMAEIRQQLETMVQNIGAVDFDLVFNPIIDQLQRMAEQLAQIDLSSLSEITVGALKVSVKVVVDVDFTTQITDVLLAKLDPILQLPQAALQEITATVESGLFRLRQLSPEALLRPLDDLFQPIATLLDQLTFDQLLAPLTTWHTAALAALDQVTPAALLQPLHDLHQQLVAALDRISPAMLVAPLQTLLADLQQPLAQLDITAPFQALDDALQRAMGRLDALAPATALAPLVGAFDTVQTALDAFQPSRLLQPLSDIFAGLAAPLAQLNATQVAAIGVAFAPLRTVTTAFDPALNFHQLHQQYPQLVSRLQELHIGKLIADLKGPYDAMHLSFQAGGAAGAGLAGQVTLLNPLQNSTLGQLSAGFQQSRDQLQHGFPTATPPAALATRYQELKPRLDGLAPSWLQEGMTVEAVRQAFTQANPFNIAAELDQLYGAVKEQWRALDPRLLQAQIEAVFTALKTTIAGITLTPVATALQTLLTQLQTTLGALDLQLVGDELQAHFAQLTALATALDPSVVLGQLETLTDEVKTLLTGLQPAALLSGINAPLQAAKAVVATFDPAGFKAPLQAIFAGIDQILAQIDVGPLVQPLIDRLEQIKDELKEALTRTAAAFNAMLAAIPV
jgi:hypothetical protein